MPTGPVISGLAPPDKPAQSSMPHYYMRKNSPLILVHCPALAASDVRHEQKMTDRHPSIKWRSLIVWPPRKRIRQCRRITGSPTLRQEESNDSKQLAAEATAAADELPTDSTRNLAMLCLTWAGSHTAKPEGVALHSLSFGVAMAPNSNEEQPILPPF